ncbi:putative two component histidine kinase 1 [Diaporthe ampelina]|uniref:Putative two component histidine kinase 1 n=1 Tax=Diaporthe ampelina TaxID=1214573 RepID=A0A0G2FUM6_9PEZI|nr:putative two component histidine kinase 1 [Diaporthe ampelina]
MPDPDFEQLANAGLSVFDLNSEYLSRKDWSKTPLGPSLEWQQSLTSYINLIKALPHPAAVFWGSQLSLVHNFAWGAATNYHDGQGHPAIDYYRGEARSALQSAVTGRTVRIVIRRLTFATVARQNKPQNNEFLDKSEKDQDEILSKALPPDPVDRHGDLADAVSRHGHIDLKQSQLFQRFSELLPTGLAILNHNAEAVFVNDQFFSLTTKKTSREFRSWPESIDPRDYERVMSEYREAFRARRDVKVDFRCVSGDEGERNDPDQPENDEWRMFLLRPLNSTRDSGYICAVVDITELKTAELAQERTARDAKSRKQQQERFIDMVSHEIRNPLSAVLHLAEEIKETSKAMEVNGPQSDQVAEIIDAADTILVCVSHQSVLVDDILNFSKLDSAMMTLAPGVSQPKEDLSKQLKVFQAELKTNRIGFEYALDVSFGEVGVDWVVADLARIKQVLVNLMTNAIKFTSRTNGERNIMVALGASIERPKSYPPNVVFFNDYKEEGDQTRGPEWGDGPALYLMVAVKDTGIGISAQDQARLFERFRQATPKTSEKYGGSGLGLSISRKLCQLHGGDIGQNQKEPTQRDRKVLKRQLQNHGFQVFTANNGQEAVDAVVDRAKEYTSMTAGVKSPEDSGYFSCILMDQEMPVKDGNTAAREIKDLQAKGEVGRSPILGVSANVRDEQTKVMKEAGMDEVISKPFKVKDLVKRIDGLAEIVEGGNS